MNLKHIPNMLSYTRIVLSFLFAYTYYEMIHAKITPIIALTVFIAIILTDIFDGYIARKNMNATNYGAFLDVTADIVFVFLSYAILSICNIITPLFMLVLIIKFLEFIITSKYMKTSKSLVFDSIGRNVSKFWIALPGLIIMLYFFNITPISFVINLILLISSILALISTIIRLRELI